MKKIFSVQARGNCELCAKENLVKNLSKVKSTMWCLMCRATVQRRVVGYQGEVG